jgi:hypothetical protein
MAGGVAFVVSVAGMSAAMAAPKQATPATVWLCKPGLAQNPCDLDLATTVVRPDGSRTVEHPKPAKKPPVDCFYVYPTVSGQQGPNADLTIDPEEIAVAEQQASRFSQVCRVFAPMYSQLTVSSIASGAIGRADARANAYNGVRDAWLDYLAHDNHGRGVVFIGHSQGAGMLIALLRMEVDPKPALRKKVVSALLLGGNVTVPIGAKVGGSFQHLPVCDARDQTGCVVAYSSFDETPPPKALFGRPGAGVSGVSGQTANAGLQVVCVNPADPAGGTHALAPFFRTVPFPGPVGLGAPSQYQAKTPWVELPKLYTAECRSEGGATWLNINHIAGADDTRPQIRAVLGPNWGLHLGDVNVAFGNLVDLVRDESKAYTTH